MHKSLNVALMCLLATGCTIQGGDLAKEDRNKVMTCTDTRDGEVFKFNTNTIANFRQGISAPHSFDIVTLDGVKMTLRSDMEAWLKCKEGG